MNPFNKNINDVKKEDLDLLKTNGVAESLFIEYKADIPAKIGKHVAAFANTHGGYLFLGVKAGKDNTPESCIGISKADWTPDRIIDTIKNNLNSMPVIHLKAVDLPDPGRVIYILQVEESLSPPHIFSDSRIYVRNPTSSDPIAEDDRQAVYDMFRKAERAQAEVENAMALTRWRTRFKPERPHDPISKDILPEVYVSIIICPLLIVPRMIPLFKEETTQFLITRCFIHGGSPRHQQYSIIMDKRVRDDLGTVEYSTEISANGLIEFHLRLPSPKEPEISLNYLKEYTKNLLSKSNIIYKTFWYLGKAKLIFGINGIQNRRLGSGHRWGSDLSRRNWCEIEREFDATAMGEEEAQKLLAEDIDDELYRCFGY